MWATKLFLFFFSLSLSLSICLSFSQPLFFSVSLSLSVSLYSRSLSLPVSLFLSLCLSLCISQFLSLSISLSLRIVVLRTWHKESQNWNQKVLGLMSEREPHLNIKRNSLMIRQSGSNLKSLYVGIFAWKIKEKRRKAFGRSKLHAVGHFKSSCDILFGGLSWGPHHGMGIQKC